MLAYTMRLAVVGLWSLAISGLNRAEGVSWDELTQRARELCVQGDFLQAEAVLRNALKETDNFGRHDIRRAETLQYLGRLYREMDRLPDAEKMYQRSVSAWEESLGKGHLSLVEPLTSLASLYLEHGLADRAERLVGRLHSSLETLDSADPRAVSLLHMLAALHHSQRRYDKAEPLYRRALECAERTLGTDDQPLIRILNNLGLIYAQRGRHSEAIPYLERALTLSQKTFGPSHVAVARSLANLGELYSAIGRHMNAELLFQRALAIAENSLGGESRLSGQILAEYSVLMREMGRKSEAKALETRAETIRRLNAAGDLGRQTIHIRDLSSTR